MGWRRGPGGAPRRRSGPPDEEPWWDPVDQAFVEQPLLGRRDLGKGWTSLTMVNNAERLDPFGDDQASLAIRAERGARGLTALDEGQAWRQRRDASLVVLRVETFATADESGHRAAWRAHGVACLDEVWRARWKERDRTPGWIEARWKAEVAPEVAIADEVDWIQVEDQTDVHQGGAIHRYEHLTIWGGRAHAIVTFRHDHTLDVDDLAGELARNVQARICARRA